MSVMLDNIFFSIFALIVSFALLFKSAGLFVDSSVGIAEDLKIPKMIVGILLVGFATTAPEIAVSVQSAYLGYPEIALGNAIGSVICNNGVALALAGIVAPVAIPIDRNILKTAGLFLIFIDVLAYILALNGVIGRFEGSLLVLLLIGYVSFVIFSEKRKRSELKSNDISGAGETDIFSEKGKIRRHVLIFLAGLIGVVITSRIVIWASINIAEFFNVSEIIIGLTVIAIGTSLPEISTAITAAVKGEGELAAGDIIGADILNILWIIGVSSVVRPIHVETKIVHFSFLWMFLLVGTMLVSMRIGYKLGKIKGFILLFLYVAYLLYNIKFFY